ncbi:recombination protein O N-terminal domain-containing protein [Spiroplasma endosymbiont of Phyllotreta cruciferae]|nr:recombination protein O N-terminal domain-containing protein [Spiroplasma endosymbiont of Phyllotreta cruciferae]
MTTKVTGIVINKQSYDDSEIITVFTKELGKLAFLLLVFGKLLGIV